MRVLQRSILILLAAAPFAGDAATAQQPERRSVVVRPSERERIRLVTQRRARLGVSVDLRASANDSVGATVLSVTPGGPAAKAGIKSGDVVTRLDGKPLVGSEAPEAPKAGEDESLPGLRLVEIASKLEPSQTVTVEYRRNGTRLTTSLVTGDQPITVFEMPEGQLRFEVPKVEIERLPRGYAFGTGPGQFSFEFGGPLGDLQLASLNPELGQYFGTSEGVLVINVPKDSPLGLKPGDVVLAVDGRKVTGPSSVYRILRSYDPGDSFKLDIMRNKSRTSVTGRIEQRERREQ